MADERTQDARRVSDTDPGSGAGVRVSGPLTQQWFDKGSNQEQGWRLLASSPAGTEPIRSAPMDRWSPTRRCGLARSHAETTTIRHAEDDQRVAARFH